MYNLMDADLVWMAVLFCVLLVVVGSFFLLNVILAILSEAYDKVDETTARQQDAMNKRIHKSLKRAARQYKRAHPTGPPVDILSDIRNEMSDRPFSLSSADVVAHE